MSHIRKLSAAGLGLALSLGGAAVASAQVARPAQPATGAQQGPHGRRAHARHPMVRQLFRGVDLTDQQKTQLEGIRQKYAGQARTQRQQELAEVRAVLTPAQQAQFDRNVSELTARAKARGERRGEHRGARGARGAERLFAGVDLTEQQKTQIKALRQRYEEQNRDLREQAQALGKQMREARQRNDTATVNATRQRFQALRPQLQARRQQELTEVRALLTPAQQAQFDKNVAQLRDRMQHRGR